MRPSKIKYVIVTFLTLVIYFHLMEALGLADVIELRLLNGLFLFLSIFSYLKRSDVSGGTYVSKLVGGFSLGVSISVLFAAYITCYLLVLNPIAYTEIMTPNMQESNFLKMLIPVVIFAEASASSFLFSYISMQYLKKENTIRVLTSEI